MDESSHWHECRCGAVSDKSGHDWKVENAKDATATVSGYTGDKICQVCGYTVKGTEIPATGTTTPVKPGDGDSTNSGNGTDADSTKPGNGTDADSTKPGNGTNTDATKPNETMTMEIAIKMQMVFRQEITAICGCGLLHCLYQVELV